MKNEVLIIASVNLLKSLVVNPSFSGDEAVTANIIELWFKDNNLNYKRYKNNLWACNKYFDSKKPTVLLNSHHDTVEPNKGYTLNPFNAEIKEGKLFGLGSNDAGASLVCLAHVFLNFYNQKALKYNLVFAASAEEEISGKNGLKSILKMLPKIDFAVVGEPTKMQMAIAEKGLLVIDGYASGKSGHAAHKNTVNAISEAMQDINWLHKYKFKKKSAVLGDVKTSVTQINAGLQHNVVPEKCHFVIDVRVNENYQNKEVFAVLDKHTKSQLIPRSFNLNSSGISESHPFVQYGKSIGLNTYGSPTLSDQTVLNCPSLKIGPGDSTRSHSADEFIFLSEIEEGIEIYLKLFKSILK